MILIPYSALLGGISLVWILVRFSVCKKTGRFSWKRELQLPFYDRVTDIDDLILNSLGYRIGYGIWRIAMAVAARIKGKNKPKPRPSVHGCGFLQKKSGKNKRSQLKNLSKIIIIPLM